MGFGDFLKKLDPTGLVGAGLDLFGGIMQNKSQEEAAKAQQLAYNQWLKDRSQTVDDIAKNLKARGIDIYGPQVTTTNQSAQNEVHSVMNQTTVSDLTKTVGKGQEGMYQKLNQLLQGRLGQTEFVSPEERMAAESQINKMQQAGRERIGNAIGRMGLPPSSMQAAMLETPSDVAANQARLQALANFANINREEAGKARAESAAQLQAWQGQHQRSNTSGTTDTYGSSSGTSSTSAPPDYLRLLSFLQPPAPNQPVTGTGQSGLGSALQGAGAFLGGLSGLNQQGGGGLEMPTNLTSILPSALSYGGQGSSFGGGSYSAGGDFMTTKPTTITVGDNPGNKEIVSVRPVSGMGKTHVDPASGLIALKRLLASRRA